MDPRFRRILRPIAAVVVVVFTWISFEPWNYIVGFQSLRSARAAQFSSTKTKSSAGKFEESLDSLVTILEDLDKAFEADQDVTLTIESLLALQQSLQTSDAEIKAEFSSTEAFLKKKTSLKSSWTVMTKRSPIMMRTIKSYRAIFKVSLA